MVGILIPSQESKSWIEPMELFDPTKPVRLRSHRDKYLVAADDQESVCQDKDGSSVNARWEVELVEGSTTLLRLKSCFGRYLTASATPFLLGMTGKKVLQTVPEWLDSSVEWEPVRDGFLVMLKTQQGHFLRANAGPPPWRNSITHDLPQVTVTKDWVLWAVEITGLLELHSPLRSLLKTVSLPSPGTDKASESPLSLTPNSISPSAAKEEPPIPKYDGRTIHYAVADDDGNVDASREGSSIQFKGRSVRELTRKLEEETELRDIVVCYRNPLNGNLCPLRVPLPPNMAAMRVVVVRASSTGYLMVFYG